MKNTIKTTIELFAVAIMFYYAAENEVIADVVNSMYDWLYYEVDMSHVMSAGLSLGLCLSVGYMIVDMLAKFVVKHVRISFVFDEPKKELKETAIEMKEAES